MKRPVIVAATRTPIGKFRGALASLPATALGAAIVKEVVRRSGMKPAGVDEVIMGNVVSAGLGQNPARQAALGAGLPVEVAAMTINKVCGSGLKAVALAAQAIQTENSRVVVAGGMESMSRGPHLLTHLRDGYRLGHGTIVDAVIHDGLWDVYEDFHMGCTGEVVASEYRVSRERQDAYALESHRRAVAARTAGRFRDEIHPLQVPGRHGAVTTFDADESPRPDATIEALSALKPVFRDDGTVTAGNAPGLNDGAAAVLVTSGEYAAHENLPVLATIAGQAVSGIEPRLVMMAPVQAVRKLTARIGWALDTVDLVELNEAFAVQGVAVVEELGLDPEKVNVNGGAVALGHPIGASGARILVTLIHEMIRRDVSRGIAALCLGGGNAVALAVERP